MTQTMTVDPRYPIGKFVPPSGPDGVSLAQQRAVIAALPETMRAAVAGLSETQLDTPYRDGCWTVRQVTHHVADSHMHAYMRTKHTLMEDLPTIKAYEEADWAELPDSRMLPVEPSLQILEGVHARWSVLLDALTEDQWQREYLHPQYQSRWPLWKVVALYEWHCRHHVAHITELRRREGW
jgi:hypothetical protein